MKETPFRGPPSKIGLAFLCLGMTIAIALPWLAFLWAVGLISF